MAAKRIRSRAIKLQHPQDKPLVIFLDNKKTNNVSYIDDIHIRNVLQEAPRSVYNISKKRTFVCKLFILLTCQSNQ